MHLVKDVHRVSLDRVQTIKPYRKGVYCWLGHALVWANPAVKYAKRKLFRERNFWRPRGGIGLQLPENIIKDLYPVYIIRPIETRSVVPVAFWDTIQQRSRNESLRTLAKEFSVSYETIRRIVKRK